MSAEESEPPKNLGGRPQKPIDPEALTQLLRIHPTFAEIGTFFGVCERTIERRYKDDEEFRRLVDDGRSDCRASQRRAFMAAVDRVATGGSERGDSSLVIFLAKQREAVGGLAFKDRHEHDVRAQHSWADLVAGEALGDEGGDPGGGDPDGDGAVDGEA
jgi:hypothetical protein